MHLLVFLEKPHRSGVNFRGLGIEDDCRDVETGLIALRLLTELFHARVLTRRSVEKAIRRQRPTHKQIVASASGGREWTCWALRRCRIDECGPTAKYVRGLEPGKGAEYSVEYAELVPAVATGV